MKNLQFIKSNSSKGLSFLAGVNRPVDPKHIDVIAKSVARKGATRPVVATEINFINGVPQQYIVDGQHLYCALMREKQDIPYILIPIKDHEDLVKTIAEHNVSSKSWNIGNYVDAWASYKDDYRKLNYYHNKYDFDYSVIGDILYRKSTTAGDGSNFKILKLIKTGFFEIHDEEKSVQLLNQLTDIFIVIPRVERKPKRYLIRESLLLMNKSNYNHNKFMNVIEKKKKEIICLINNQEDIQHLFKF